MKIKISKKKWLKKNDENKNNKNIENNTKASKIEEG